MAQGVKNLTEGKIYKQLLQLALPLMATGFIQMAYTLTDMAWVGRLGSRELAAIGAVGIVTWIIAETWVCSIKRGNRVSSLLNQSPLGNNLPIPDYLASGESLIVNVSFLPSIISW